jgi:hypothetical protein
MKHIVRKKPDIARVNAIAQLLRLWVLEIVAWVSGLAGVKFRPDIAEEVRAAKLCVFLHAVARCPARGRAIRTAQAHSARRGHRITRPGGALRVWTRGVKIRGLKQLRALLEDMEPAIAVMVKRLMRPSIVMRLIADAPGVERCVAVTFAPAPEGADTS